MNRNIKTALRQAFDAPAPERKQAFLQGLMPPRISMPRFVLLQVKKKGTLSRVM